MINVAIVEDEQEAVEYLSDCLHRYGEKTGETFSFTHFPEPITFLEKYKPVYDLVFMDIRMPMMDGMQAAKKLREADTSVLLVFVTMFYRSRTAWRNTACGTRRLPNS